MPSPPTYTLGQEPTVKKISHLSYVSCAYVPVPGYWGEGREYLGNQDRKPGCGVQSVWLGSKIHDQSMVCRLSWECIRILKNLTPPPQTYLKVSGWGGGKWALILEPKGAGFGPGPGASDLCPVSRLIYLRAPPLCLGVGANV